MMILIMCVIILVYISNNNSVHYLCCLCICLHLIAHLLPHCAQCTFFPASRCRSTSHLHGERKIAWTHAHSGATMELQNRQTKLIKTHLTTIRRHPKLHIDHQLIGKRHASAWLSPSSATTSHLFNSFLMISQPAKRKGDRSCFFCLAVVYLENTTRYYL